MIKACYFDFNGTLFFDAEINRNAWRKVLTTISNNQINFDVFYQQFQSVKNSIVIETTYKQLNMPYTNKDIEYWVEKKEEIYREQVIKEKLNSMSEGAELLLKTLKKKNIHMILCTSSIQSNVNFYYDHLHLDRWFNKEETVYDDGTYQNKINMYKQCIKLSNTKPQESLVFEDSPKSIFEAIQAGCTNIIAIKRKDTPTYPEIKQIIKNFKEFDYEILENNL